VLDLFLDDATLEDETRPPPSRTRRITLAVQPPPHGVVPSSPQRQRRRVSFFDVAPSAPESSVSPSWLKDQQEDDDTGNPLGGRSASGTGREWAAAAMDDEHQVRRYFPGLSMMEEAESDGRFDQKYFVLKFLFFSYEGFEHFGTFKI
jgi:hypothetical protein